MDHVQNAALAAEMKEFFQHLWHLRLRLRAPMRPEDVAIEYAKFLWGSEGRKGFAQQEQADRSRYDIALAHNQVDLNQLTMRVGLISDTLLLSQHEPSHSKEISSRVDSENMNDAVSTEIGFRYSDLETMGRWIVEAKPLLESGLAWYLPHFWETRTRYSAFYEGGVETDSKVPIFDFLIEGQNRLIDITDTDPIRSAIVRPILKMDLPFLEGISLKDYSEITVNEFDSYTRFRDFLRGQFLSLDDSLYSTESERALMRIGIEIRDQVREVQSELAATVRKRAVASGGAVVGSAGAVLAAVYGPAFEEALKILGVSAGLWGVMESLSANSAKRLKDDKWYYVWALYKKRGRGVI